MICYRPIASLYSIEEADKQAPRLNENREEIKKRRADLPDSHLYNPDQSNLTPTPPAPLPPLRPSLCRSHIRPKRKYAGEDEEDLHDHFEELVTACRGQNITHNDRQRSFANPSKVAQYHIKNRSTPLALGGR